MPNIARGFLLLIFVLSFLSVLIERGITMSNVLFDLSNSNITMEQVGVNSYEIYTSKGTIVIDREQLDVLQLIKEQDITDMMEDVIFEVMDVVDKIEVVSGYNIENDKCVLRHVLREAKL